MVDDSAAEFTCRIPLRIRISGEADLECLEWFGLYTHHREIIRATFERQQLGECLMLQVETALAHVHHHAEQGWPVAQLWIDFERHRAERCGYLWALRVFPSFRRVGLGGRLVRAAERALLDRGYALAETGVEKHNRGSRRFFERLGYRQTAEISESYEYTRPDGVHERIELEEWVLRRPLAPPHASNSRLSR